MKTYSFETERLVRDGYLLKLLLDSSLPMTEILVIMKSFRENCKPAVSLDVQTLPQEKRALYQHDEQ